MARMIATEITPSRIVLARNLQRILDEKGRGSKTQLAAALNWPKSHISRLLKAENNPDLHTVDCLADALDVSPSVLLSE